MLLFAGAASAETVVSDRAAALVVFPHVTVCEACGTDSVVQLSNTSNQPVAAQCYYVDAVGSCSINGGACYNSGDCGTSGGLCVPRWTETDFRVYLTARQPLAWRASEGLGASDLPLNGTLRRGPGGQSNAGSRVPPFGVVDSVNYPGRIGHGELKCYTINEDGSPSERNVLIGHVTTIIDYHSIQDAAKSSAVGLRAIQNANNGDANLVLGGDGAEYDGCPSILILDHFFDFAVNPTNGRVVGTTLVLAPCTEDMRSQVPSRVVTQYLVFNEFEQRFSTSRLVDCFQDIELSAIDTTDGYRSIFSVGVAGTVTGQTRIRGVNGGLLGVAFESHGTSDSFTDFRSASFNLQLQGERAASDVLRVVP